jgi:hypothetical protein
MLRAREAIAEVLDKTSLEQMRGLGESGDGVRLLVGGGTVREAMDMA